MPKYYEFKIAGYYLYFTSYCVIECMHVHASDRRLTEAGSAKFFVRDNGDTVLQERGILTDRNGKALVTNRSVYTLELDTSLAPSDDAALNKELLRLIELLENRGIVWEDTLPLTAEQNEKLAAAGAESRTVTVGVRPVHVTVGDEGIDAQIDVSELMGSELHLHMTAGGKDVVAVVQTANLDPNAYARHTAVKFSFEPRLIHLFDPETEKNLI